MKSPNWKESVEFIGIFAIVASLIFVGLELRQSQKVAIASQYQMRISFSQDFLQNQRDFSLARSGERARSSISEFDLKPALRDSLLSLPPLELGDVVNSIDQIFYIFDNNHYQYQSGFVDEESWLSMRSRFKNYLHNEEFARQRFLSNPGRFRPSLVDEVRQMFDEDE